MKIGLSMLYCLGQPFSHLLKQLREVQVGDVEILDEERGREPEKAKDAPTGSVRTVTLMVATALDVAYSNESQH
jgi:hypothetical protein